MGLEAECTVRLGRKTSAGRALLEGDTLIFRGDFDLQIPFEKMRDLAVDGATLIVKSDGQEAHFDVGPAVAERWLRLIKEPKSLLEKLEVGPQLRVAVVDVTDSLFVTALREHTAGVADGRVPVGCPVVFFGAETREALAKIHLLRTRMVENGALWIIRPKGSKAISEGDVFEAVKNAGLVDTKVVALSKTHTAHKCVIPVEMRGQPVRRRPQILSIPPSAPTLEPKKAGGGSKPSKPPKAAAPTRSANKKKVSVPPKGKTKASAAKKR